MSDYKRIYALLAAHSDSGKWITTDDAARVLTQAGFGHVPDALHRAANEVETALPVNCELLPDGQEDKIASAYVQAHNEMGLMLHARADRAGGTA